MYRGYAFRHFKSVDKPTKAIVLGIIGAGRNLMISRDEFSVIAWGIRTDYVKIPILDDPWEKNFTCDGLTRIILVENHYRDCWEVVGEWDRKFDTVDIAVNHYFEEWRAKNKRKPKAAA